MKKLNALLVLLCLFSNLSFSQTCLPTGIVLTTQAEVDAFAVNFPSCTDILGNVEIGLFNGVDDSDITNLSAFSQINTIGGNLRIGSCDQLTSLNGLDNLISVGGDFDIQYNDVLADISGIDGIQSVSGLFRILGANGLTDISGLNNFTSVGILIIGGNDLLTNITGFNGFTEIAGNLSFGGSNISSISGFSNLTKVEGDFILGNIPMLTNISGFNNLNRVNGKMTLVQLDSNPNFAGLEGLTYLGAADIINNGVLENLNGLSNIDTIAGRLYIENNSLLPNLSGLDDLKYIGKLKLAGNPSIISLSGIENVTTIADGLEVIYNNAFTDVSVLTNSLSLTGILSLKGCVDMIDLSEMADLDMSAISNLELVDNTLLTFCNSPNVCNYISTGGVVNISNNAVGCNTITEILANCNTNNTTTCFPNEMIFSTQAQVDIFPSLFPNCTAVTGDVSITGTVNNLDSLIQITTIGGDLRIDSSQVENLTGLDNLTSIGEYLSIAYNSNLISLSGFESLISVGNTFALRENYKLSSLSGLSNLQEVGLSFYIGDMDSTIVGFEQFHDLTGLENLTRVGGSLLFQSLTSLTNLSGFENLDSIGLNLEIFANDNLVSLEGLEWMTHLKGGGLYITGNQALTSLTGLENLEIIEGGFNFSGNFILDDISAINNLHTIEGRMICQGLSSLTSLEAFNNLINVEEIEIAGLDLLTSLSGLENVNTTNLIKLSLMFNPLLSFCNQPNICDFITDGGNAVISDNAFGCNDIMLMVEICNPSGSTCSFGNVALTNQSEVDNFPSLYPNCTEVQGNFSIEGDVKNLDSLEQLISVLGTLRVSECDSLMSLNGLHNINSVGGLWIAGHKRLKNLNGLENLAEVSSNGIVIGGNDSLITLQGIGALTNIGTLTIDTNPELEDISSLSSLTSLDGNLEIRNCYSLTSLFGLQNITSVSSSIFISSNTILENIQAIENIDLELLSGGIELSFNPALETCNLFNICNHIANMGGTNINNNASGCNSNSEIEIACADNFSKVNYFFFYDFNQNKIQDNGEVLIGDLPINVSPIGITSFSDAMNGGTIFLNQGDYILTYDTLQNADWNLTTDSVNYYITIDAANSCDSIYFGIYPKVERSYMISLLNGPPARCGEYKTFEVHAKNLGSTVTNGTIWLEVDDLIAATSYIDVPDTIIDNTYGWHFDNLFPGFTETKQISLQIPIPPNVVLGDSLHFNSSVHFEDVNGIDSTSIFNYVTEVRCSFDPNDKLVNPSRNNNLTLFEEDLIYTIRFQNTGNDEAYDIIIRDTLDENLEPTTFRVLSTSHPNSLITTMEADQFLTFNFENIYLPDSTTNFDASQGYVSYMISPKEGLAEETPIENTASIYFDFNPPIVTNTTESVMVSELPTSIHHLGGEEGIKIEIFPNPVSDYVFIKKEKSEKLKYQIIDVNGRLLMSGELVDEIHNITFTKINSGVYFVKIINPVTREYIVEKIVK